MATNTTAKTMPKPRSEPPLTGLSPARRSWVFVSFAFFGITGIGKCMAAMAAPPSHFSRMRASAHPAGALRVYDK